MKRNDCVIKIILFVLAFSIFDLIKFTTILVLLPKEEPDVQDRRLKVKKYKNGPTTSHVQGAIFT